MRALLQRVSRASVAVDGGSIASIGPGLLLLLGVGHGDDDAVTDGLARRATELRIFRDEEGRTNRSILDIGGAALVVSQFTLYADTACGRRPGFTNAAPPELANRLYLRFADQLRANGVADVQTGSFGTEMAVELVNDGPFTIWLDTGDRPAVPLSSTAGLWSDRTETGEDYVERVRPGRLASLQEKRRGG
ncbi:MAG TPA: D-aminoacyl-tRNA deacylase [Candidatus Limnocylindrales bacterium]|nr:D-aminoacyl-tRNA deacylase [Candidatus Limnocylindrales bacterium]